MIVVVIADTENGIVPLLLPVSPDADCVKPIVVEPTADFGRRILPHISAIAVFPLENV